LQAVEKQPLWLKGEGLLAPQIRRMFFNSLQGKAFAFHINKGGNA